jgi:hypothetical protein
MEELVRKLTQGQVAVAVVIGVILGRGQCGRNPRSVANCGHALAEIRSDFCEALPGGHGPSP